MRIGDMITWKWSNGVHWDDFGSYSGLVIGSRITKTDREKIRVYDVLDDQGIICSVRDDNVHLKLIGDTCESR
jgi:hypothetical protein